MCIAYSFRLWVGHVDTLLGTSPVCPVHTYRGVHTKGGVSPLFCICIGVLSVLFGVLVALG